MTVWPFLRVCLVLVYYLHLIVLLFLFILYSIATLPLLLCSVFIFICGVLFCVWSCFLFSRLVSCVCVLLVWLSFVLFFISLFFGCVFSHFITVLFCSSFLFLSIFIWLCLFCILLPSCSVLFRPIHVSSRLVSSRLVPALTHSLVLRWCVACRWFPWSAPLPKATQRCMLYNSCASLSPPCIHHHDWTAAGTSLLLLGIK